MKHLITIIALAAAAAAHAQSVQLAEFTMTPLPDQRTLVDDNVHIVWRVTGPTGNQWETRIVVSGCAKGTGFVGTDPWHSSGSGTIDQIGRISCNVGGQS